MTKFNDKSFVVPVGTNEDARSNHARTFGEKPTRDAPCGHAACARQDKVECLFVEKSTFPFPTNVLPAKHRRDCVGGCGREAEDRSLFCAICACV